MKANTNLVKRPLYQKLLVIAALTGTVGGILTGIMTYMNIGISDTFLSDWFSAFAFATLVISPIGFLMMTLVTKLVQLVIPNNKRIYQQLAIGFSMAFIMESLLATSTTATTIGFIDKTLFINAWVQAFITALPFGLLMTVTMSLFLKPKLEQFMTS